MDKYLYKNAINVEQRTNVVSWTKAVLLGLLHFGRLKLAAFCSTILSFLLFNFRVRLQQQQWNR